MLNNNLEIVNKELNVPRFFVLNLFKSCSTSIYNLFLCVYTCLVLEKYNFQENSEEKNASIPLLIASM